MSPPKKHQSQVGDRRGREQGLAARPLLVLPCRCTLEIILQTRNRNLSPKRPAYSELSGVFYP